jgi:hypothetical protein
MDQTLAELVRRHLTAENAQDLDGTLATLHPDCRFEDLATGQVWLGPAMAPPAITGNRGPPSTSR